MHILLYLLFCALQGQTTVGGPSSMTGYPSEVGSGYPTSNGGAQQLEGGFTPHSTSGLSSGSGLSTVPHLVNIADLKVIAQQSVSCKSFATMQGLSPRGPSGSGLGLLVYFGTTGSRRLGRALVRAQLSASASSLLERLHGALPVNALCRAAVNECPVEAAVSYCIAMQPPKLSSKTQSVQVPAVKLCLSLLAFAVQETKMNSDVLTPINDWLRTWRSFR